LHEKGIETFLSVAMSRTLGKAATLLNVSQSTISYNLRELENDMGMILVDRQKGMKSVRLTPAGESFLPLALKWQEINREIANARNPKTAHSLAIGGTECVNCGLLSDLYSDLLENNPPIHLRICTDPSDQMYQAVESRALDIAIVVHEEASKYVITEPFFRENLVVARIPEEGEKTTGKVNPASLEPELEFYIEWGSPYRLWHDHLWDPTRSVKMRLDSVNLVSAIMVLPGQWCMVPESAVARIKRDNKKVKIQNIVDPPPDLIYYKLTHRYPKASAQQGLEIFDEVAARRGFGETDRE
jgi:DNA-binding transcriptional LysR family regulator